MEMLVVLTISFILLFIFPPSLKYFFVNTSEEIIRSQLLHSIQFAQQAMRTRFVSIGFCKSKNHVNCSGNWEDGQLIFIDRTQDGVVRNRRDVLVAIDTPIKNGKIYWRSFPIYRDYLSFSPKEFSESDNGTFWYCRSGKSLPAWAIVLNKSGNIRVIDPDKSGVILDSEDKPIKCEER